MSTHSNPGILCLLTCVGVLVAVEPEPVSHTVSQTGDGSMIVVLTGRHFGAVLGDDGLPMAATQVWDTVDNIPALAATESGFNIAAIIAEEDTPWMHTQSALYGNQPLMLGSDPEGRFRHRVYSGTGRQSYVGHARVDRSQTPNRMYISWWYMPSVDPGSEGGSNKFVRVWDDGNGYGTRISWTHMHLTYQKADGVGGTCWGQWNKHGVVGAWNRHEILVDLERGLIRTWVNGHLHLSVDDAIKHEDVDPSLPLWPGLVGFDHGSGAYADMETRFSEIYVSGGLARVEIANQPTWTKAANIDANPDHDASLRNVQPIVSWADDSISFSLERGLIDDDAPLYVYVVNPDGAVNEVGVPLDLAPRRRIRIKCSRGQTVLDGHQSDLPLTGGLAMEHVLDTLDRRFDIHLRCQAELPAVVVAQAPAHAGRCSARETTPGRTWSGQ